MACVFRRFNTGRSCLLEQRPGENVAFRKKEKFNVSSTIIVVFKSGLIIIFQFANFEYFITSGRGVFDMVGLVKNYRTVYDVFLAYFRTFRCGLSAIFVVFLVFCSDKL